MTSRGRLVITINTAWNIVNFRSGLVRALVAEGYEVLAAAPSDPVAEAALAEMGARFAPLPMESRTTSVAHDLGIFARYRALFRRERPLAMLGYTIKPNTYGSIAARGAGVARINNISGLGTGFMRPGLLNRVVRGLYRQGLRGSDRVFFQNADDRDLFLSLGLVQSVQAQLLPGSGIDLDRFAAAPQPDNPAPLLLFIGRMLGDKGVRELIDAARIVRRAHPDVRFRLVGFLDVDNRTAIGRHEVESWVAEGLIEYQPPLADVRPAIAAADAVILPSYREGTSRVLLEAAAIGRPLIATDVPGCREVVSDGENGFLCAPRNAASLADAIHRFLALDAAGRARLGAASRALVERDYAEQRVIDAYLTALDALPR